MKKQNVVNTADSSQLIVSAHSLMRICVEFQFNNGDEKPKAKIILGKLMFVKVKMLLKFTF